MAITKTWLGGNASGAGDLSIADNYLAHTIRSGAYKWSASGSGTNEYYLEAAAGGDPGILEPANVQAAASNLTAATAGALTAASWDWADNDTLGYSTVYLRLSDGADPDTEDLDHVTYTKLPAAGDALVIPGTSVNAINAGLQSLAAISLGDVRVEAGYAKTIGSGSEMVRLTCTAFTMAGSGVAYIDLQASAISPVIRSTSSASTGKRGLYLVGSALSTVIIEGGHVGIAWRAGETATVSALRISGGSVWIGSGTTLTTLYQTAGSVILRAACTTVTTYGGSLKTEGAGAITTVNLSGGACTPNSSGTITTCTLDGGSLDLLDSMISRTITTLNYRAGSLSRNPDVVTITTENGPTRITRDTRVEV